MPLIEISESSQVAEARRAALVCARMHGLDETDAGKVALVTTELGTNLLKHGGGGHVILMADTAPGHDEGGVTIIAMDKGPGMQDVARSLVDGYSTAGTRGNGLGSIRRASHRLDVFSAAGRGTVIAATVGPAPAPRPAPAIDIGAVCVPYPGEQVCGDAIAVAADPLVLAAIVVDGLGHGRGAAEAARAAIASFREQPVSTAPAVMIARLHERLRDTRGAAAMTLSLDLARGTATYAGVGNVGGAAYEPGSVKRFVSHNGTLGHEFRRAQEFSVPWTDRTTIVLHSDGVSAHFKPEDYPGLSVCGPLVIAALVYRDFRRHRDDASVLVLRPRRAAAEAAS